VLASISVTATARVPPTVEPLVTTSAASRPVTGSSKVMRKVIGETSVGSAWPGASSMVPTGPVVSGAFGSHSTTLSMLVLASLALPPASTAPPAGTFASTSPAVVMPVTSIVYEAPVPLTWLTTRVPPAVEADRSTSSGPKPVTGSENSTSNRIGATESGSDWPAACSTVTVGSVVSTCSHSTTLSTLVLASLGFPAPSTAAPAARSAWTSPSVVMPETSTV
jgi:hypothetical protein